MTAATEAAKPDTDAAALAIVVFGRNDVGKPRAAAFGHSDAQLAEKAAGRMGMRVLRLETDKARELAGRLPRGRVFASGRVFVPFGRACMRPWRPLPRFPVVGDWPEWYRPLRPAKARQTALYGPGRARATAHRPRPATSHRHPVGRQSAWAASCWLRLTLTTAGGKPSSSRSRATG